MWKLLWLSGTLKEWWSTQTKKDVIHHQVGCESWETHTTHFLQESEAKCQFPPMHDFFGCILIFEFLTFECLDIVFV